MNQAHTELVLQNTAQQIDNLRIQHDLTFRELSKKTGIAPSALHGIMQGIKSPSIYTICRICEAFNVSLSDFFNFDQNILALKGKENVLISIFRELSPMSQDTLIKTAKCMK